MPIIKVLLLSGHAPGVKTRLANMLTDSYRMVIPAPYEAITIAMEEIEHGNYMRGGATRRRVEALPDPIDVITSYDDAFSKGDYAGARAHLTDDFFYLLPGDVKLSDPEQAAAWLTDRAIAFEISGRTVETAFGDRGPAVYLRCRMSGTRGDGAAYAGVRAALRYEFVRDRISSIELWSDFAPLAGDAGQKTG